MCTRLVGLNDLSFPAVTESWKHMVGVAYKLLVTVCTFDCKLGKTVPPFGLFRVAVMSKIEEVKLYIVSDFYSAPLQMAI